MKHFIFFFTLLLALPAWGQVELPPARDVDKEYRKEYRKAVREYNRAEKRIDDTRWDVVLGPGESVPTDVVSAEEFRAMEFSNWYRDLVAPDGLAEDMAAAAKRKGVFLNTDTGCDTDHPDLQVGKLPGDNYTADPCPDIHGHGTHTVGITYLILKPLIDAGFIQYKMAKFLDDQGRGAYAGIVGGVKEETSYLSDNFLDYGQFAVANASWGGGTSVYQPLADEIGKSKAAGVAWFFAAGNSGGAVIFPGLLDDVSAIGSLDKNLQKSSFSCFGPELDFVAGGRDIYSALPGGKYGSFSGTSMATPAVTAAGAAAMCFYPSLTAETLPGYLAGISTDLGEPDKDDLFGWGMQYIRAILDNPPAGEEPEPEPPTCEDGIKNGKEKGVDCGGPDCPPCEPEEPGEPEKPDYRPTKRTITIYGKFPIGWFPTGQSLEVAPENAVEWDLNTVALIAQAARKDIVVTEIGFVVDSESTYEWEYDALKANVERYFRNRAIGTPEGWDGYDKGRYIPFFLDWNAARGERDFIKQDLTPARLRFELEGREYEVAPDDLPGWEK